MKGIEIKVEYEEGTGYIKEGRCLTREVALHMAKQWIAHGAASVMLSGTDTDLPEYIDDILVTGCEGSMVDDPSDRTPTTIVYPSDWKPDNWKSLDSWETGRYKEKEYPAV